MIFMAGWEYLTEFTFQLNIICIHLNDNPCDTASVVFTSSKLQQESTSQYVKQEIRAFCSARSLQNPRQVSPQQPQPQQQTPTDIEFEESSELPYDILESSE